MYSCVKSNHTFKELFDAQKTLSNITEKKMNIPSSSYNVCQVRSKQRLQNSFMIIMKEQEPLLTDTTNSKTKEDGRWDIPLN